MAKKKFIIKLMIYFNRQDPDNFEYLGYQIQLPPGVDVITYQDLLPYRKNVLESFEYPFQNYMYYFSKEGVFELIKKGWQILVSDLPIDDTTQIPQLPIIIRSSVQVVAQDLKHKILSLEQMNEQLWRQNQQLKRQINHLSKKIQLQLPGKGSKNFNQTTKLDLALFFSEPLFNSITNSIQGPAVSFQSELKRMIGAAKYGYVSEVNLQYERATLSNLKGILFNMKPKIVHIICHGDKYGNLKFQKDSIQQIGLLDIITPKNFKKLIEGLEELPQLVFINACYSQEVGKVFFERGVNNVICINAKDEINDEAAKIFSQKFYFEIFKGFSALEAYQTAKNQVQKEKYNLKQCCCFHKYHKQGCLWKSVQEKYKEAEAHEMFHVPSAQCSCLTKNQNKHFYKCKWARNTLQVINKDYQIQLSPGNMDVPANKQDLQKINFLFQNDELMVCCCLEPGKIPHSQSQKFKIFCNTGSNKPIFKISKECIEIYDHSSSQLKLACQNIPKAIKGRQDDLYFFIRQALIEYEKARVIVIYGNQGNGKTGFAIKAANYMNERKAISGYQLINIDYVRDKVVFSFKTQSIVQRLKEQIQLQRLGVKAKNSMLILQNCDSFLENNPDDFYSEIKQISEKFKHIRILILVKKKTHQNYSNYTGIHPYCFQLGPLDWRAACIFLFRKIRDRLAPEVKFKNIEQLSIGYKHILNNVKNISNYVESMRKKDKISLNILKKNIENQANEETLVANVLKDNLDNVLKTSPQAYRLLLFISQFSEGISFVDLENLSIFDQEQFKNLNFPIRKNWFQDLRQLLSDGSEESQLNLPTQFLLRNKSSLDQSSFDFRIGQNYFLSQTQNDKIVVKRYIRDYIWNKHVDGTSYQMKFVFVTYIYGMLDFSFKLFNNLCYFHEQILFANSLSKSGIFSLNTGFEQTEAAKQVSDSMHEGNIFNKKFTKVLSQNMNFQEKMKMDDPKIFIMNHNQQFLNIIYTLDWEDIYNKLQKKKNFSHRIFLCYFENLLVYIPTALKIAKAQLHVCKSLVKRSLNILSTINKKSKSCPIPINRYFILLFKLTMMKIQIDIQDGLKDFALINESFNQLKTIFNKEKSNFKYPFNPIVMQQMLLMEFRHIQLYMRKITQIDQQSILKTIREFQIKYEKQQIQGQPILYCKHGLLIAQMFVQFITFHDPHESIAIKLTKSQIKHEKNLFENISKTLNECFILFKDKQLWRLALQARICIIKLIWQIESKNMISMEIQSPLFKIKKYIEEAFQIFKNYNYKLGGFNQKELNSLNMKINEKIWQLASNTMIFMRAVPISKPYQEGNSQPIIQNLTRKSHQFKSGVLNIFKNKQKDVSISTCSSPTSASFSLQNSKRLNHIKAIDISIKFQILTKKNLLRETKYGCSLLMLTANTTIIDNNPCLLVEDQLMRQEVVLINEQFINNFNIQNVKILILVGQNANQAIEKLFSLMNNPPALIALNDVQACTKQMLHTSQSIRNLIVSKNTSKIIEVQYIKQLFTKLNGQKIENSNDLQKIHVEMIKKLTHSQNITHKILPNSNLKINFTEGVAKNLSPEIQCRYNIELDINKDNYFVMRRWEQLQQILKFLNYQRKNDSSAWINIFGQRLVGKTYFSHELVRILIERQAYSGIFIFEGSRIERKFNGDFHKYIEKQHEKSKLGFPNLSYFVQERANCQMLIIIDDFHLIKQRNLNTYKGFLANLQKIKAHVIMVTSFQLNDEEIFVEEIAISKIKKIKLSVMSDQEIDILAYNMLSTWDQEIAKKVEKIKNYKNQGMKFSVQSLTNLTKLSQQLRISNNQMSIYSSSIQ